MQAKRNTTCLKIKFSLHSLLSNVYFIVTRQLYEFKDSEHDRCPISFSCFVYRRVYIRKRHSETVQHSISRYNASQSSTTVCLYVSICVFHSQCKKKKEDFTVILKPWRKKKCDQHDVRLYVCVWMWYEKKKQRNRNTPLMPFNKKVRMLNKQMKRSDDI